MPQSNFVEAFRAVGYGIVSGVLDTEQLAALRADIERVMPATGAELAHHRLVDLGERWFDLAADGRIIGAVSEILGCIPSLAGSYAHRKPANSQAHTRLHSDIAHLPGRLDRWDGLMIKVMYALDRIDLDGGSVSAVPGSHVTRVSSGEARTFALQRGDALVFDAAILHTSRPNRSQRDRLTAWFIYTVPWMRPLMGNEPGKATISRANALINEKPGLQNLFGRSDPYSTIK